MIKRVKIFVNNNVKSNNIKNEFSNKLTKNGFIIDGENIFLDNVINKNILLKINVLNV